MRTKKLIKHFVLENKHRSKITLGPNTRLNPDSNAIELKSTDDLYPLDTDLYVKTWVANPMSVVQWIGFECMSEQKEDDLGVEITGVNFRLSDGADEYWYNGATWEVNTTNWNTENEVSANISTFSATSKKLQVVINPYTTDETVTPKILEIKVLYESNVHHQEDYIYKTFVRKLRDGVNPISDHVIQLTEATDTIDLNNSYYSLDTSYNILSIDAVFDHSNDSEHFTNILSNYNSTTKVITLTSSLPIDTLIWIQFVYEPEIIVNESAEYNEVAKVPAILISNISFSSQKLSDTYEYVANKNDLTAVKILAPRIADIEMEATVITGTSRDQSRMFDNIRYFFDNNQIISSYGLDEEFSLQFVGDFVKQNSTPTNGIHSAKFKCKLAHVLLYERESIDAFIIEKLKIENENVNAIIE